MGNLANPVNQPGTPVPPAKSRYQWSWDDFFVAGLAVVSIPVAAVLVCVLPNQIPPILPSVLLATGLAALTYRFLGGLEDAGFQMYGFKAAGGLAALALITWGINYYLQGQDPDTRKVIYTVTGTAVDGRGNPVRMDEGDVLPDPTAITVQKNGMGSFTVDFPEEADGASATNSKRSVATIRISHIHCPVAPNDSPTDMEQCYNQKVSPVTLASEPIKVNWNSFDAKREFWIGEVRLNSEANPTSSGDLKQVEPLPAERNHPLEGSPAAVTHLAPPPPTKSEGWPQGGKH